MIAVPSRLCASFSSINTMSVSSVMRRALLSGVAATPLHRQPTVRTQSFSKRRTNRRVGGEKLTACSSAAVYVSSKMSLLHGRLACEPSAFHQGLDTVAAGSIRRTNFHTSSRHANSNSSGSLSAPGGALQPVLPSQSTDTLIESWFYTVAPRGSVSLNLPFKTVVRPLNAQDYPDMDKVIIEVHFDKWCTTTLPPSHELSHIGDLYQLSVLFDKDTAKMNVTAQVTSGITLPVICMLWVPLQSDLSATVVSDKDLTVEKMESNMINLATQRGNCYLKSLKCGSVNVQCSAGNIVSKSTLLGNVIFHAGVSGSIQADKLQGSSVVCETEMGAIAVKSLYADTAIVRTTGGCVHLGQCHGQMLLQAGQADVKIESMEGDVDVGLLSGKVDVHLSRHSNSNIDIKDGDISLSFPEGTSTDLDLDCPRINVGKNVPVEYIDTDIPHHTEGFIGERGKASIHARTVSGTIDVRLLDWIHTTKLAFQTDKDF